MNIASELLDILLDTQPAKVCKVKKRSVNCALTRGERKKRAECFVKDIVSKQCKRNIHKNKKCGHDWRQKKRQVNLAQQAKHQSHRASPRILTYKESMAISRRDWAKHKGQHHQLLTSEEWKEFMAYNPAGDK
jgi:hypothetical protein